MRLLLLLSYNLHRTYMRVRGVPCEGGSARIRNDGSSGIIRNVHPTQAILHGSSAANVALRCLGRGLPDHGFFIRGEVD